jgi:hypothetical protein
MRYQEIDNIVFTDYKGKSYTIKDMREYPTDYTLFLNLKTTANDMIDEIANRKDIYGSNSEHMVYKIYENNIIKLFESEFDMNEIKTLAIPS